MERFFRKTIYENGESNVFDWPNETWMVIALVVWPIIFYLFICR